MSSGQRTNTQLWEEIYDLRQQLKIEQGLRQAEYNKCVALTGYLNEERKEKRILELENEKLIQQLEAGKKKRKDDVA